MTPRLKGILLMLAAMVFFTGLDGTAKFLVHGLPAPVGVFFRYAFSLILSVAIMSRSGGPGLATGQGGWPKRDANRSARHTRLRCYDSPEFRAVNANLGNAPAAEVGEVLGVQRHAASNQHDLPFRGIFQDGIRQRDARPQARHIDQREPPSLNRCLG